MTTYVDTSTLLKLFVDEPGSDRAALIWDAADALASVSLVVVEARAALAAATRGRRITAAQHDRAKEWLTSLLADLHTVTVTDELLAGAADLAEAERLRACDAIHLAAALTIEASIMTSADEALCAAANRRGLHVANPLDE